jgi:hypothetical protein
MYDSNIKRIKKLGQLLRTNMEVGVSTSNNWLNVENRK